MTDRISYWLASAPESPARAILDGDERCDVAVLGGGIAGLTAAYLLARDGVDVALLEAATIGSGATGNTTAKVTSAHGLCYAELARRHSAETPAAYASLNEQAIALIDEIRMREKIECGWRRRDAYTYSIDPKRVSELEAEAQAAGDAGLRAELVDDLSLPFSVAAAVRVENQAEFHPVLWLHGLAVAAEQVGARIFERSRALGVSCRGQTTIRTERGTLRAERVIVATHYPILDRGLFFPRLSAQRSYCIAARPAQPLPDGMFLSVDSPTRSLRSHTSADGEEVLIAGGEGHKVGEEDEPSARYAALEAWARKHFGVSAVDYSWSAQDPMTPDKLPYVGALTPGNSRILVATGFSKWGMTNGTAAAALLCDAVTGRDNPLAGIVSSNRFDPLAAVPTLIRENASVARHLIGDRFSRTTSPADLQRGEGAIVRDGGQRAAAFRDDEGNLHRLASTCTHLGCELRFNNAERSWDCPCHGSRFDAVDGRVLEGPAVDALAPIATKEDAWNTTR
jgi:glycine/D-amino acid oxidase-like deaminating enzyme/nitrite reductase/ring-hydroxylating ferredoxin subunit